MNALDLAETFAAPSDEAARWSRVQAVFGTLGGAAIAYGSAHQDDLRAPTVATSMPPGFLSDYFAAGHHARDTWLALCAADPSIVPWRLDARTAQLIDPGVAALFADYGFGAAMLVPAHGGTLVAGITVLGRHADEVEALSQPRAQALLRLVTATFACVARPERLLGTDEARIGATPRLSARETEVLTWLAEGHRIDRIAEKMRIRPVTVSKHIAAARRKLGARTREEALAVAILRRFVHG
ncbi:MAG: LuxR C-terminal-related transcriptional regulator [Pseudomonadota bacterium]